ncbi:MAG: DNA polymerase III subunit delta [Proteobacteria bacterium]|nr:DNA polymerase III subunit delta [Pseudomonadota bacterium]
MKIRANQLSPHLKKSLAPCYLVTGDEHLLVSEALDEIRDAARERGFGNRELHVATTGFDWGQLTAGAGNLSLFAERRIVELRLPTGKPGRAGGQAIVDLVERAGPDLLFIVTGPKLDKGAAASKWAKSLDEKGVSLAVWPIGVRELPGWIANRMLRAGLQPDRDAVTMIADRVEGNLLAAGQEVEKLRLLLGEGVVTADDVASAVADSSRFDVYKLTDAAMAGDARRAIRILGGLRAEGVEPVIVMWALTRELRTLATLDDAVRQGTDLGGAMRAARVWNNRQGLVRSCIGRHRRGDFHRMLKASGRADAAAKGQRHGDPWQMAADIVIGMANA